MNWIINDLNDMMLTPNNQKRQKVLDLLGAFAYLETVISKSENTRK